MGMLLATAIYYFSNLLIFLIFLRAILSWFPEPRNEGPLRQLYYSALRIAHTMTDPITGPIRKLMQNSPLGGPGMMLDFSPIIAFFLIRLVANVLRNIVLMVF